VVHRLYLIPFSIAPPVRLAKIFLPASGGPVVIKKPKMGVRLLKGMGDHGYLDPQFSQYREAAITHNIMPDTLQKIEFTFGLYMRTFFCDPTGMFFSMIEM
jgi:hypothetical protein